MTVRFSRGSVSSVLCVKAAEMTEIQPGFSQQCLLCVKAAEMTVRFSRGSVSSVCFVLEGLSRKEWLEACYVMMDDETNGMEER